MIKALITDFFKTIEEKDFKNNKHAKATFWVEELQEAGYNDKNYVSIKKATRLYEKYVEGKEGISVRDPNKDLRDFMASYIGFENYDAYVSKHPLEGSGIQEGSSQGSTSTVSKVTSITLRVKLIITAIGIGILSIVYAIYQDNDLANGECILWNGERYEKSSCLNPFAINNNTYHIDITTFQKIKVVKGQTAFFDGKTPLVWYGPNKKGKREYFNARGIHPETLKELKPITRYILEKEGLLYEE